MQKLWNNSGGTFNFALACFRPHLAGDDGCGRRGGFCAAWAFPSLPPLFPVAASVPSFAAAFPALPVHAVPAAALPGCRPVGYGGAACVYYPPAYGVFPADSRGPGQYLLRERRAARQHGPLQSGTHLPRGGLHSRALSHARLPPA